MGGKEGKEGRGREGSLRVGREGVCVNDRVSSFLGVDNLGDPGLKGLGVSEREWVCV